MNTMQQSIVNAIESATNEKGAYRLGIARCDARPIMLAELERRGIANRVIKDFGGRTLYQFAVAR